MIVEVAARNTRQKKLGYNAALELDNRIKEQINKRKNRIIDNKSWIINPLLYKLAIVSELLIYGHINELGI